MSVSPITTHVLDTAKGKPAQGIHITLEEWRDNAWLRVGNGETDADGRLKTLLAPGSLREGTFRITFDLRSYYGEGESFYPEAAIVFVVRDRSQHYHVPLLLSPYGYSTYRGS